MKFLDDDTHVYNGNALQRYLKMRKWLLMTAAFLFAIKFSWYQHDKFNELIPFLEIPEEVVKNSAIVYGLYLLIQCGLLLLQVQQTYDDDLHRRRETVPTGSLGDRLEVEKKKLKELKVDVELGSRHDETLKDKFEKISEKSEDIDSRISTIYKTKKSLVGYCEVVIDIIRVFPPMLFLTAALASI